MDEITKKDNVADIQHYTEIFGKHKSYRNFKKRNPRLYMEPKTCRKISNKKGVNMEKKKVKVIFRTPALRRTYDDLPENDPIKKRIDRALENIEKRPLIW